MAALVASTRFVMIARVRRMKIREIRSVEGLILRYGERRPRDAPLADPSPRAPGQVGLRSQSRPKPLSRPPRLRGREHPQGILDAVRGLVDVQRKVHEGLAAKLGTYTDIVGDIPLVSQTFVASLISFRFLQACARTLTCVFNASCTCSRSCTCVEYMRGSEIQQHGTA